MPILSLLLNQLLQKYTYLFIVNVDITHAPSSSCVSPEGLFPPSAVAQKELAMSMKQQDWIKSVKHLQPGTNGVRGCQGTPAP